MLGLTSLGGVGGTAGGEAGLLLLRRGLAEKGGKAAGGGGCSAGGSSTPLLPCCRRDASGSGAAEEAVPARFSANVVTEAVDPVGVGRNDCDMYRCESVGRLDLAAAGSLPPSKSLLLYLVR
ncbi:hypothetical protein HPB50_024438 [Hyalomma asiaticum]|uniref:Uncharacterized protein n=1 Tax=Hyalomma asiaticum TaxID=266040 RepID=A0ACB7SSC9_HYAAI|nr:hypothetical protein HPB50_024438 [Hyalomma asiaticum]